MQFRPPPTRSIILSQLPETFTKCVTCRPNRRKPISPVLSDPNCHHSSQNTIAKFDATPCNDVARCSRSRGGCVFSGRLLLGPPLGLRRTPARSPSSTRPHESTDCLRVQQQRGKQYDCVCRCTPRRVAESRQGADILHQQCECRSLVQEAHKERQDVPRQPQETLNRPPGRP